MAAPADPVGRRRRSHRHSRDRGRGRLAVHPGRHQHRRRPGLRQPADDVAARALLQLLIPGLVGLANRWRHRFDGIGAAGWEVIARATELINRLRSHTIHCSPAGYIIRSIERDLAIQVRREERISSLLADTDERQLRGVERTGQVASAEAAVAVIFISNKLAPWSTSTVELRSRR
jgi:hypothetical protein